MNLVEHIGSGVKRIREALKGYGMKPPLIQAEGDWFSITFMRKGPHDAVEALRDKGKIFIPANGGRVEGVSEGMDEGISEGIKSLLVLVQEMPGLRAPQLSKALGVPAKTLERWLKLLKEKDLIEFRGSRRFGGYRRRESRSEGSPVE